MSTMTEINLECMLLDEAAEPKALPFYLLSDITYGFSDALEIGRGGFAIVYKAMLENGDVAVKRLSSNAYMYENEFHREIECLMKVKHKNIVRFLGYCADTEGNVGSYNGKFVMADVQHRLLCFEYLPKGSLHDYIEDASGGLEWIERYKIIKGICEGLCYLHQKNILHLDLKPANILLDENMLPKITDFGLARCFDEEQTQAIITKVIGTLGYLAPEHTSHVITHKFDLYSLGVIITEILTGKKGYQPIENILESWSNRLQISQGSLEWEQIKVCAEIGLQCTKFKPGKRPRSMKDIMDRLVETEGDEVIIPAAAGPMELLHVHPLELFLPFEYKKLTACSLYLTNNTNELVAFRLIMDDSEQHSSDCFVSLPVNGIVPPRSTYTLVVTAKAKKEQIAERNDLFLESTTLALGDKLMINTFQRQPKKFLEKVKDTRTNVVQQVRLKAVRTPLPTENITSSSKPTSSEIKMIYRRSTYSLDTNHSRQWIITGQDYGHVRIWNNQTQKLLSSIKVSAHKVTCVKFISRKQWFVVGMHGGLIHVYNCDTKMQKITSFSTYHSSVDSLAIHPTQPYLLSSYYICMDLWDWDKGWKCAQIFEKEHTDSILQVAFNRKDTIATVSKDNKVKIWMLNSTKSSSSFIGHSEKVNCLDFFTCYDQEYLVTGSDDCTAKIWDIEKKKCVRTLEASMSPVTAVLYEPKLQYLIIGSKDGCIYLWSATNSRINARMPRLERIVNIGSGGDVHSLAYLIGRVVIGKGHAVAIMNISNNVKNLEESTDDYSETLSSAYYYTTRQATDTPCKVMYSSSRLLDVALELIRFPCEPNESILCLVHLTNSTDEHVAFMLKEKRSGSIEFLAKKPLFGIVPSRSSYALILSMTKEELAREQETGWDLILQSSALEDTYAVLFTSQHECLEFFEDAKEKGNDVHEVAVLLKENNLALQLGELTKSKEHTPVCQKCLRKIKKFLICGTVHNVDQSFIEQIISMRSIDDKLCSLDAHPTEQWIITGHVNGYVCTWNHETQGPMDTFKVSRRSVTGVKVIGRKQWILVRASDGCIYVYNCACVTNMQKMTSFSDDPYGKSLAVHPSQPYVLTTGTLWNWDKGWECTHEISSGYRILQAVFNPKDANSFACASKDVSKEWHHVQVWNSLDSHNSDYTLSGHLNNVNCLEFFNHDDRQYLITGSDDYTAKIWDLQKKECIHTMEVMSQVTCVISLPDRPYLVTGSEHGTVQLWSSTDFRLLQTIKVGGGGPVRGLACFMASPRVVIGQEHAITTMEIGDGESVASEGSN